MRIAFFAKYSRMGASSRYRTYQYLEYLSTEGIGADVFHLFGDEYLQRLYSGRRISFHYLLKRLALRIRDILKVKHYDVIVIEKELIPYLPAVFERLLKRINPRIIVDYDDAIFANYAHKPFLKGKIAAVMGLSAAVNVGNRYLLEYAQAFNQNVNLLPTAIDFRKYPRKETYELTPDRVTIGWIGTPITSRFLFLIQGALARLSLRFPIVLRCVGASPDFSMEGVVVENVRWDESTEAAEILSFDVGIMPLPNDSFTKGKCGLKLIQYMACGIPSVASPIGVNRDLIFNGENGLIAYHEEAWVREIEALILDSKLRKKLGQRGRRTVVDMYSSDVIAPKLLRTLRDVAHETKRSGDRVLCGDGIEQECPPENRA